MYYCVRNCFRITSLLRVTPSEVFHVIQSGNATGGEKSEDSCRFDIVHECEGRTDGIAIKPLSQLRFDYDTTTHSITTEVIEITICVQFDCDTTTTKN